MTDKVLVDFITGARKRGFSDVQIRKVIDEKGWPAGRVEDAFNSLQPKFKIKNQVCVFLGDEILEILEKRAKKSMFKLHEQIEDILRRSTARKTKGTTEKLDDALLACFSRANTGKKAKKKKKKKVKKKVKKKAKK